MRWRLFDHLSRAVVTVSALALVALVALTGWQVWGRYVLNDTPTWTEKAALLLVLVVALPMAAVGLREDFHLAIGFAVDRLPPCARRWVGMANAVALGAFGVMMVVGSWPLVRGTWGRDIPLIGLPQGLQYAPLIVAGALIAAFMAERLWFAWRTGPEDAPPEDPTPLPRAADAARPR